MNLLEKRSSESNETIGESLFVAGNSDPKELSLIEAVKPILDELIEKAGFRISKHFYAYIMKNIDE